MTKKEDKKYLIMAILINVGILGGVVMFVLAGINNILWLIWVATAFFAIIGIICPILTAVIKFKSASDDDKRMLNRQLRDAKQTFTNMDKKELLSFIFITTVILLLFVLIIVFGILANFNSKFLIPMFICIGIFVGFGFIMGIITSLSHKNVAKKILNNTTSKTITSIVISKEVFGSIEKREKYKYKFLIMGKEYYAVSLKQLEPGDEVQIMYNNNISKHCAII